MEELGIKQRKKKKRVLSSQSSEAEVGQPSGKKNAAKRQYVEEDSPLKGFLDKGKSQSRDASRSNSVESLKQIGLKPRKNIPKGFKRVVREKVTVDPQGYTVVEEYSSCEEMTQEELNQKAKPVPKNQATLNGKTKQGALNFQS